MQRESSLRVDVDKAVSVASLLRLVIQSHLSVFAIRQVNVVTETCDFSLWIVSNIPNIAVLNRSEKLGGHLFCDSSCLCVNLLFGGILCSGER